MCIKLGLHPEREQNANAAFENDVNVRCRCVTEARQTAFGCVTNIQRTLNATHQLPVHQRESVLPDDNGRNPCFEKLKIRINPYTHKSV